MNRLLRLIGRALSATALTIAAILVAGGLMRTGGAYAHFYVSARSADHSLSLKRGHEGASSEVEQSITNIAPGDVYNDYITLTNGTADNRSAQNITLAVAGFPPSSTLISPPLSDGTIGLQVSVAQCSAAWTVSLETNDLTSCPGIITSLLSPTAISALSTGVTLVSGTIRSGSIYHLRVSLSMPSSLHETTINGVTPATSIQGQSVTLTYTFAENQRQPEPTATQP